MAKLLKLRRGTTSQHSSFTGAEGEVTVDTDKETLVVHDGSTAGGHPVAAEDMANVSSSAIAGRLSNDSIAVSKIAAGTLPSDVKITDSNVSGNLTITSADIVNGTIANADLGSDCVNGSKIADDSIDSEHYVNASIDTAHIGNDQVTFAKMQNVASQTIFGRAGGGTGDAAALSAADVRGIINVENGATADQTAEEIQDIVGAMLSGNTESGITVTYQDSDGTIDFSVASQTDQNFTNADHSKLDGIESGATADQSASEILTAIKTVDGASSGLDADVLDGQHGSYYRNASNLNAGTVAAGRLDTATTQSAGNNSTKIATTAFVTTAISNADAFPSGTKMIFQQTSAPTGWTKVTSNVDNRALRVVSGTAGSGGSNAFTNTLASRGITANAGNTTATGNVSVANATATGNISVANASTGGTVNSHTLSISEMPSHNHTLGGGSASGNASPMRRGAYVNANFATSNTGGGGGHSHGFTGGSHNHNASFSGSAHSHNASFSGSAHNHSISVSNLDMAVQYLDVIIAQKD